MADFNPDQFLAETQPGGFDPDAFLKETAFQKEKVNPVEAATMGLANMGSYGFAPRIQGAIGAAKDYLGETGEDHTLRALGPVEGLKRAYNARTKQAQGQYEEAANEQPGATFAGEIAGGYLAPGPAAATVLGRFGRAVAGGMAMGAGSSPDLTDIPDTVIRMGAGGVMGGALHGALEKGVPAIKNAAGYVGKKLGNMAFSVPEWATERYMKNPVDVAVGSGLELEPLRGEILDSVGKYTGKVDSAKEALDAARSKVSEARIDAQRGRFEANEAARDAYAGVKESMRDAKPPKALAPQLVGHIDNASNELSKLSSESFGILEQEGHSFDSAKLMGAIKAEKKRLKIGGIPPKLGPDVMAYDALGRLQAQLSAIENKIRGPLEEGVKPYPVDVPARTVKRLIQTIDGASAAAYGNSAGALGPKAAESLSAVRSRYNQVLRGASEAYADKMDELAPRVNLLKRMGEAFGSEQQADAAFQSIAGRGVKGEYTGKLLAEYDKAHGTSFLKQIESYLETQGKLQSPTEMTALRRGLPEYQALAGKLPDEMALDSQRANQTAAESMLDAAKNTAQPLRRLGEGNVEGVVKSVGNGRNFAGRESLEHLDSLEGSNYVDKVQDLAAKNKFRTDKTTGSKGVMAGGFLAGKAGVIAGMARDKYGGQIYQKLLSGSLHLGKFADVLGRAAQRGQPALVATHEILMRNYPEYKALIESQTSEAP